MSEFEPGRLVRLAPGVHRLVAPNASLLTGPGTNTFLLGEPPTAVIDPGPASPEHLDAIRQAAPRLTHVFVTHTHPDHSPGARPLAEESGALLVGLPAPAGEHQDETFVPDVKPQRDQCFVLEGQTLRAVDTPGHASNHVCYVLEEQGLLFSGDHILDGVTPVIPPPDGDMAAYIESLRRLRDYPLHAIAPGHGRLLTDPHAVIDGVIAHRLRREAKVLAALEQAGRASLDALLALVYRDTDARLHRLARSSLEAHLIKLEREGRCMRDGDRWTVCRA